EIKVAEIVTAQFGAKNVTLPRHVAQGNPQEHLARSPTVERRGVDEVQPALEGHANARQGLLQRDAAAFLAQRRGAETQNGQSQTGSVQETSVHRAQEGFTNSGSKWRW